MAARFTPIAETEMSALMKTWGFTPMRIEGTRELVWQKTRPELEIQLRIYSGINPTGESRGVGEDAIRCEADWFKDGKTYRIGGSKRVNRTQNWQSNLRDRVSHWKDILGPNGEMVRCPLCNSPMVLREIRNGQNAGKNFWGCSLFSERQCRGFKWEHEAA